MVISAQEIPNSHTSWFYTENLKEAVGVRLDPQEQLVVQRCPKGNGPQLYGFKIGESANVFLPDTRGASLGLPSIVVVPVMEPRICRTTNSCTDGAKVGQNVFFPSSYFWSNTSKFRSPNQRQRRLSSTFWGRLFSSASRQLIFDHCPLVFGFWRKLPSIKSLGVRPGWPCFIATF